MRISFLGNFQVPYCSEVHHTKTLESMGHTVIRLQENEDKGEDILLKALQSDLFVLVHTHGWKTPGKPMKEVVTELKKNNIPTLTYHLDLYMGLERWEEYRNSDMWLLDHFFTVDKLMAEHLNSQESEDKPKGHFIPAGVFDQECILDPSITVDKEVIFVGSKGYHPEWPWRPKLIDWLKDNYERFEHWGGDGLGVVREMDLNTLYQRTKVIVGDTLCLNYDYPHYFSDRLFETTGRGGFIIFPYIKGIEDYFEIGKEIVTYELGNFEDLKKKIDYYLENDEERETIRHAGHLRSLIQHTYKHRWEEILNKINEI